MNARMPIAAGLMSIMFVACAAPKAEQGAELQDSMLTTTVGISSQADNMRAYSDLVKAQAAYLTAMGDYNLKSAEAEFKTALAAQEWIKAEKMQMEVDRLKIELFKLQQAEAKALQKANLIEERALIVNQMIVGNVNATTIAAMQFLQMNAIPAADTLEVMTQPVGPIAGEHFIGNAVVEANGFPGGNVGQYFQWLKTTNAKVEPYSPAHLPAIVAVQTFAAKAEEKLVLIKTQLIELNNSSPL